MTVKIEVFGLQDPKAVIVEFSDGKKFYLNQYGLLQEFIGDETKTRYDPFDERGGS